MNALLIITLVAMVAPIFGDESVDAKRQDKRGVVGVGYGSHYPAAYGAHGYAGYSGYPAFAGYGHGYVPHAAPLYSSPLLGHGIGHGIAAAPAHTYGAALPVTHGYSHGYNSASILAAAPWRVGYNGLHGAGYGHGLGYVNGW